MADDRGVSQVVQRLGGDGAERGNGEGSDAPVQVPILVS
jgi:hypothetical protein